MVTTISTLTPERQCSDIVEREKILAKSVAVFGLGLKLINSKINPLANHMTGRTRKGNTVNIQKAKRTLTKIDQLFKREE